MHEKRFAFIFLLGLFATAIVIGIWAFFDSEERERQIRLSQAINEPLMSSSLIENLENKTSRISPLCEDEKIKSIEVSFAEKDGKLDGVVGDINKDQVEKVLWNAEDLWCETPMAEMGFNTDTLLFLDEPKDRMTGNFSLKLKDKSQKCEDLIWFNIVEWNIKSENGQFVLTCK